MLALVLAVVVASAATPPAILSEFTHTCLSSRSLTSLNDALRQRRWNAYSSPSESKIGKEIAAVTPMLKAQGLASDYVVFRLNAGGRNLELAVSKSKKALTKGRKLIGCSIYDFAAATPVTTNELEMLAGGVVGQKSVVGDVVSEKWDDIFGPDSGMRAAFIPMNSPIKAQVGFSGMMLGTHFLDGAMK